MLRSTQSSGEASVDSAYIRSGQMQTQADCSLQLLSDSETKHICGTLLRDLCRCDQRKYLPSGAA